MTFHLPNFATANLHSAHSLHTRVCFLLDFAPFHPAELNFPIVCIKGFRIVSEAHLRSFFVLSTTKIYN